MHNPLIQSIWRGHDAKIRRTLRYAPRLASQAHGPSLPLHLAAAWSRISVLEMLLDAGVPIGQLDSRGATALHHAGSSAVVALLIARGAAHTALDASQRLPIATVPSVDAQLSLARLCDEGTLRLHGRDVFFRALIARNVAVARQVLALLRPLFGDWAAYLSERVKVAASWYYTTFNVLEFLLSEGAR